MNSRQVKLLCAFFVLALLVPCVSSHALDISLGVKQNVYSSDLLDDAQGFVVLVGRDEFSIFFSYESTYMRLMGLSVADCDVFGIGARFNYNIRPSLSLQVSPGMYFMDMDVIYNGGMYNESLYRYLNSRFGDRLWDCYNVEAGAALGFGVGLRWEGDILGFLVGYRFLRMPVKYIGWDEGYESDSSHGWWHSIERLPLSCAYMELMLRF